MNVLLLIILIAIYMCVKESKNKNSEKSVIYGTVTCVIMYLYFFVIWPQKIVTKKHQKSSLKHKMLWINMKDLDVTNDEDIEWAKNILINQAPNKLGCYVDEKHSSKKDVLKHIEIFNMMFQHLPKYIKFKYKVEPNVKEFCNQKKLKIVNHNLFRRTI